MSLTLVLYLIDLMTSLGQGLWIVFWISILLMAIPAVLIGLGSLSGGVIETESGENVASILCKKILKFIWIPIFSMFIAIVIPDEKTMYMMAATSYIGKTNIPAKAQEALELKLDSIIKGLKGKTNEK